MLREGADVRLAVSAPALAAPAFVAGLFGDRVPSVFLVRGRMLAVIDLTASADDAALVGRTVRALAVDYRFLPVALVPAEGPPPARPLDARLAAGDRLIAITDLNDLQRLLRRQPAPAAFAVEATECPLPMRGWLAGLLRTQRGLGQEEAERELERLPCRVGEWLTRGQAEDLLARLARERVAARLLPLREADGAAEDRAVQSRERGTP
jgi:hypothetical protein